MEDQSFSGKARRHHGRGRRYRSRYCPSLCAEVEQTSPGGTFPDKAAAAFETGHIGSGRAGAISRW